MSDEPNGPADEAAPGDEPETRGPRRRRTGWRRIIPTWRMVLGGFLTVLVVISGGLVAGYLLVDIPAANQAATAQTNVYLYSDGTRIARQGEVNRQDVSLSKVPVSTQHAILAAEDRNFYHESAVNLTAMARAGWNMLTGGELQSGSTITQQYVKNYYLTQERTLSRKVKEFFIAIKLDNEVSKEEILRGYLNTSYFGRGAYGIQAAAHAYYDKDVSQLTTAEGAYLAALVNAPSLYDTRANPENKDEAVARWNYVLDGMVEEGWLEQDKREKMTFPKPDRIEPPDGLSGQRGYLVNAVKDYLVSNDIVSEERLRAGGLRITTTIDRDKQEALKKAVREQLRSQLSDERKVDSYVQAGATSIDPQTGEVVAMYGGQNYVEHYINNATRRDYQVGSTFKPFVYASSQVNDSTTQDGRPITPSTIYDGTSQREVISDGQGTGYAPQNEDNKSYGMVPVSTAMNKSVNSVFAQMGIDVGPKNVEETAIALGLPKDTPNLKPNGAISLGVATASTLNMAEAYATLAEHGEHREPRLVKKITNGAEEIQLPEPQSNQAIPREAADSTTALLRGVVDQGTGTAAQSAGRPAAGKTGTAEEDVAAWFAGYTPELATVISVMGQNPEGGHEPLYGAAGLPRMNGGGIPAQIWGQYTGDAMSGKPVSDFELNTGGAEPPTIPPPGDESPTTEPPTGEATTEPPTDIPTTPGIPTPPTDEPTIPTDPETPPGPITGGTDGGTTDGGTDGGSDGGADGGPLTGGTTDGGTDGGPDTGGSTTGDPNGGTSQGWGGTSSGYGGSTRGNRGP